MEKLTAIKREKAGKGASRAQRREGFVPAVIYGDKKEPVTIAIEERVLLGEMNKKGLWTRQYEISVDGQTHTVLCQDIQKHPISLRPIHADFLRITKGAELTIGIPVRFVNAETCPAIKLGGVLNTVRRTITVKCTPENMPEAFIIDLAKIKGTTSIRVGSVEMPAGVTLKDDVNLTIATIVGSRASKAADTTTAEG